MASYRMGRDDQTYKRNRKVVMANATHCYRCGIAFLPGVDARRHPRAATCGHVVPISRGGHPTDLANLQPECRRCNIGAGASMGGRIISDRKQYGYSPAPAPAQQEPNTIAARRWPGSSVIVI